MFFFASLILVFVYIQSTAVVIVILTKIHEFSSKPLFVIVIVNDKNTAYHSENRKS